MFDTLISPRQLADLLGTPGLLVVDCRFDLGQTHWGEAEFTRVRIPGARYAHLDRDLSGPIGQSTGRHPLPVPGALADRFARWGIGPRTQVIAYDQGPGAYAARLWWLLRWMGHTAAAVLDGGFAGWQAQGLPLETAPPAPPAPQSVPFTGHPDERMVVTTEQIARAVAENRLARGEWVLVDVRSADRFAGRNETLDPVAGHVPGACNQPFTDNLESGRFRARHELRERFARLLAGRPPAALVCMCGSGVTACHSLLGLEAAGLRGARLYAGSWSEWIRDPARPVAGPAQR